MLLLVHYTASQHEILIYFLAYQTTRYQGCRNGAESAGGGRPGVSGLAGQLTGDLPEQGGRQLEGRQPPCATKTRSPGAKWVEGPRVGGENERDNRWAGLVQVGNLRRQMVRRKSGNGRDPEKTRLANPCQSSGATAVPPAMPALAISPPR